MQHSGLSSATAEFDADRLSLCELVCRSAYKRSHHISSHSRTVVGQTAQCRRVGNKRWTSASFHTAPWRECPSPLGCCHCAHLCNWRRSRPGKYFCVMQRRRRLKSLRFLIYRVSSIKIDSCSFINSPTEKWKSLSYPKFCGSVSISPSINISAPLMVDGSSLISWPNKSPTEAETNKLWALKYILWVQLHDKTHNILDPVSNKKDCVILPLAIVLYRLFWHIV